jgi:GT2 family glycosyltransferase
VTRGVSIVIPTWNGLDLLKRFLPSVIAAARCYSEQTAAPTEIVVVDDCSTDGSVQWLVTEGFVDADSERASAPGVSKSATVGRERSESLESATAGGDDLPNDQPGCRIRVERRLIRSKINSGFGEACNRGVAAAKHRLVFLLNNDVEPAVNSIAPLTENFADGSVFAAHCRVFDIESGRECGTGKVGNFARGFIRVHRGYAVEGQIGPPSIGPDGFYSMFASGGSSMFDRLKFIEIGGFESLLAPFYWEDVELSYRSWKRGYSIVYEPRSVARHRVSSTIRTLNPSAVRKIEQRNRLIYHWIHLHDPRMLVFHTLWVLLLALSGPLRRKPDFILSCVAALRLLPDIRKRRREEKLARIRTDRDVLAIFRSLESRSDIVDQT